MIGLRFPPQTCGKIKVGVASCKLEYFPSSSNRFRSDDFAERPFLHGFSARVRKDHFAKDSIDLDSISPTANLWS